MPMGRGSAAPLGCPIASLISPTSYRL
jgi:hypothetical protein